MPVLKYCDCRFVDGDLREECDYHKAMQHELDLRGQLMERHEAGLEALQSKLSAALLEQDHQRKCAVEWFDRFKECETRLDSIRELLKDDEVGEWKELMALVNGTAVSGAKYRPPLPPFPENMLDRIRTGNLDALYDWAYAIQESVDRARQNERLVERRDTKNPEPPLEDPNGIVTGGWNPFKEHAPCKKCGYPRAVHPRNGACESYE